MLFIKIYIKQSYINCYHTSIQMCGQYCILAQFPALFTTHDVIKYEIRWYPWGIQQFQSWGVLYWPQTKTFEVQHYMRGN